MQQKRKIPLRMCMGCGEMKPKPELVRIVRSPEKQVSLDLTGKMSGRGAYLCRSVACLEAARKKKRIERALDVQISEDIYQSMIKELTGNDG